MNIRDSLKQKVKADDLSRYLEILKENTRMPLDFWKGLLRSSRDVFMSAQEVKDLGLADQILSHKKRGNLRRGPRFKSLNKPFDAIESTKGLVVTNTTELATEVYSRERIQAQKCMERQIPETTTIGTSFLVMSDK